jgi:hypothetical protein
MIATILQVDYITVIIFGQWIGELTKPSLSGTITLAETVLQEGNNMRNGSYYNRGHRRVFRPERSDELLTNPGIGMETFQAFNGDPTTISRKGEDGPTEFSEFVGNLTNDRFPDTSVAYFRWYWPRIEPEQGKYRWDVIDHALARARQSQQQLHIRLMPHGAGIMVPEWYIKKGEIIEYKCLRTGEQRCIPSYDDTLFRESTERLIATFGERYDGHEDICAIDIGTLGFWGEWHNCWVPGSPLGTTEFRRWAVDLYLNAFLKTPLVMLIGQVDALEYAVKHGAGWRADSWGSMQNGWNHQHSRYPMNLALAHAEEAWKNGPVCFEPGAGGETFVAWQENGWDVDFSIEEALRWHASLINGKGSIIPDEWEDKFDAFLKKLGYRFCAGEISYDKTVYPGKFLVLEQNWVNLGVAPCYRDYHLSVRLKGENQTMDVELPHNLRTWMPGHDIFLSDSIAIPENADPGDYEIQLGIVRPGAERPVVKMANKGRDDEGFLGVDKIRIG